MPARPSSAGRVYHHDYDVKKSEWIVNCRALADGKPIWQFREAREIRPNHAITRTVPAVDGRFVDFARPKGRAALPGRQDGQAGLAQVPGDGIQGDDPFVVQRAEPARRKRTG